MWLQPSPLLRLPSSHCSLALRTPLPQKGRFVLLDVEDHEERELERLLL